MFDNTNRAIYLQIADAICDGIMSGAFQADARIASVREYAAMVAVNVNTVMRSYEYLESLGVIYNKRGLGFFVSPDARDILSKRQHTELFDTTLPEIFRKLANLNVTPETLKQEFEKFLTTIS